MITLSKNIMLTGGAGFIGGALVNRLLATSNHKITLALRSSREVAGCEVYPIGDLMDPIEWSRPLESIDVVIHCAARAHISEKDKDSALIKYLRANVEATLKLAKESANAGVKRFIFVSSIGVNGNASTAPFRENDKARPAGHYAYSKFKAEVGLWEIQRETGMDVVVIRPPLVYGPGAPGNFGSLVKWVRRGIPLPLGALHNQRSLVSIDNLVDLIITCIAHPSAANQVFLAGDGQDISTTTLLQGVAKAMGKPSRLVPVPPSVLMFGAALLGKKEVAQRLLGSLQVDISKAREVLGWEPPVTVEEGLRRCFESV